MVRKHDNFKAESWLEILVSCTKAPPTPPPRLPSLFACVNSICHMLYIALEQRLWTKF